MKTSNVRVVIRSLGVAEGKPGEVVTVSQERAAELVKEDKANRIHGGQKKASGALGPPEKKEKAADGEPGKSEATSGPPEGNKAPSPANAHGGGDDVPARGGKDHLVGSGEAAPGEGGSDKPRSGRRGAKSNDDVRQDGPEEKSSSLRSVDGARPAGEGEEPGDEGEYPLELTALAPLSVPEGRFRVGDKFRPGWLHKRGQPFERIQSLDPETRYARLRASGLAR